MCNHYLSITAPSYVKNTLQKNELCFTAHGLVQTQCLINIDLRTPKHHLEILCAVNDIEPNDVNSDALSLPSMLLSLKTDLLRNVHEDELF